MFSIKKTWQVSTKTLTIQKYKIVFSTKKNDSKYKLIRMYQTSLVIMKLISYNHNFKQFNINIYPNLT